MKVVVAVVKPFKVEEITDALGEAGVIGVTLTEVRGNGRQRGHTEVYRGAEYRVNFVPKVRLEIVLDDDQLDAAIQAIVENGRTGTIGDGKYWVLDVQQVGRIRTGEVGSDAL
jgi:nitrogen regulatory protein P-II 1